MEIKGLVSVIIPVYNAKYYISKCIDSIVNQSYKNIEIILVNDGSIDGSDIICEEYAKNNQNIKVYHQENSGPSVARNTGVEYANGEYIQFVDSDDTLDINMTKRLVEEINDHTQLVICGYNLVEIDDKKPVIRNSTSINHGVFCRTNFLKYFGQLYNDGFINPLWNKLYITRLIKNHNIRFLEDVYMGEDLIFNLEYIKVCDKVSIINEHLYNYYINVNNYSLTGSYKRDFFENQIMLYHSVERFLEGYNMYNHNNKCFVTINFTSSVIGCFSNLFHKDSHLTSKDIKLQIGKIISNEYVRRSIFCFRKGNLQKKVIGFLIKHKSIVGVFIFLKFKLFIRHRVAFLFGLLKKVNR